MADLTDLLYDRAHSLGKRIAELTNPTNPMRSQSTREVLIRDVEPLERELAAVLATLRARL